MIDGDKLKIKREKIALNLGETSREKYSAWTGCYSHLVGNKIYYRLDNPSEVCYAIRDGDNFIKPTNNTVLINSLAIQNFRAFYDTNPKTPENERYKAIGGFHTNKHHANLVDCSISKSREDHPAPDPVWPNEKRILFSDDFHHPRHANGFYIFKSADGIKWELHHQVPVLSVFTDCGDSQLGSDTMPSIFYDHNIDKYVTYLRCNIKLGVRHVLRTQSKDLIKWSKPTLVTKEPGFNFSNENLYYMGAYPVPNTDKYVSFTHHFRNFILSPDGSKRKYTDKKTLVMLSEDGEHWQVLSSIFSQDPQSVKESGEKGCIKSMATHLGPPHVVSFEEEQDYYILYVLEGIQTPETKIVRYTIEKEELKSYF